MKSQFESLNLRHDHLTVKIFIDANQIFSQAVLIFELLGAFLMVIDHHTSIQNIYGLKVLEKYAWKIIDANPSVFLSPGLCIYLLLK